LRAAQPAVVVGFVGGFVHHDDRVHQEVQLAADLRKAYPSGVTVETFANHSGRQAHREILRLLDSDDDGTLSPAEKSGARVVLFGHSWGASETVATARRLQQDGIPVLLTIQVDSVSKPGSDDRTIPANVAEAVNFYQLDGLLHGKREILAADPARTRILGNFQLHYRSHTANCADYPWYARLFMRPHIEIESDPAVWSRIEALVRATLAPK
jgi:pimeloyl-ACP methyl ester carboxylesterase